MNEGVNQSGNNQGVNQRIELPDELWYELRAALREIDAVPASVVNAAKESFTWRTVDAELAELVEDSALNPLAGVRGVHVSSGPRLLTFEAGETSVIVEVTEEGAGRRLIGQVVQPRAAALEIRHADGVAHAEADDLGRFIVDGVPRGPVSIVCRFPDSPEAPVATAWVTV